MASLEMVSTQMFECVPRDHNKKKKDLKVLVRDQFNIFRVFPVDDSGSNQDGKSKEVLECSSRSSVSETEESPQTLSSDSPLLETNSNPFYNPGQPEKPSRNEIIMGASSLVQFWEARSQQSSSSPSQSLMDSRTSSGLSHCENSDPSSFLNSLNDEAKNSGEEIDWCSQSDRSYVSDSCEKEREARCFPPLVRIRGRKAYEDILMMIQCDRKKELEWLANRYTVSQFSPRGCGSLKNMLRIRTFERCIAIQERHRLKSAKRSSRGSSVMNVRDRYKTNTEKGYAGNVNSAIETIRNSSRSVSFRVKKVCKTANKTVDKNVLQETMTKSSAKIAKKAVFSEDADSKNGLKKPETERKATEEGEGTKQAMEKATVKESVERNKTSLSIAEKVDFWGSKERTIRRKTMEDVRNNDDKAARRVIDVEAVERNKEIATKEEVSSIEESTSMEIEEYRINPQQVTSVISLDKIKEEENGSHVSRERGEEETSSQDDEETSKAEKQEASEAFSLILESPGFLNGWDENEMEEDEDYSGESEYYDWVSDISRPRSYWEDLRKQRELEVINKDDIQNMIKRRTVSSFLASDFREKIDKILVSRAKKRLQVEINPEDEDSEELMVEFLARYQEKLEENETEKIDLETVTVCNGFSQYSEKNTMITRSLEDREAAITSLSISSNPQDHGNTEIKMISLREQIKQLQREMLELKILVKSCVDFQKTVKFESLSGSVSDSLKRNCSVCFEMPIDSLLYRCGHMCTCLKCGHELQWSSKKCPICMAPIVDVVRAFLDS